MVRHSMVWPALLIVLLAAAPSTAQYFGRNKVQYETFGFQVKRTEHFDVYFYPEERQGAEVAARLAERWYERLSQVFEGGLRGRQPLILYASQPHFQQTNVLAGQIGEGTGGVTESIRRRIVLPLAGSLAATDHVIGHELVHAFQFDITSRVESGNARRQAGAERLPLWFVEGMAEYLSIGPVDVTTTMWMRDAARHEKLPRIRQLNDPRYFPYRWGHAVWAFLAGRYGEAVVGDLLRAAGRSGDVEAAFETVLGAKEEELSEAWHAAVSAAYGGRLRNLEEPSAYGRRLTAVDASVTYEVGPALSPDGTKIAFLSERDLLSVDLFIAAVETGQVIDKVSSATSDPHTTSLQFIASAGAWDAESRRLAYATIRDGRGSLVVYDQQQRRTTRRIAVPDVDETFTPSWAPDGRTIAFSGMSNGQTDLFTVDVASGRVTRLTQDIFADLQPAWAPDGRRLAFVSDRATTRIDDLTPGRLHVVVLDVESRQMTNFADLVAGTAISPQWESDDLLWFVADDSGIPNVYRLSIGARRVERTTNLGGGVAGITASSPALSLSRGRTLAFSVYEDGRHRIFVGDLPQSAVPADVASASAFPTTLPGATSVSTLPALLADSTTGLPPEGTGEDRPYRPGLGVDFFAQPSAGVAVGRYGTSVGGGVMLGMSDMLGDHNLVAAFDTAITFDRTFSASDIGAYGAYQNLRRRWNWGVSAEQLPYRSGFYSAGIEPSTGGAVLVEQEVVYRQVGRGGSGLVAYPFNESQRVEFGAGARHYDFERVSYTTVTSLATGRRLDEGTDRVTEPGITLGQASVALVGDRTFFGATGPVAGERYRLELSPTFGSFDYSGVLADYRRYVMPVSFYTLAGRVLHYGRYGSGADDPRLLPLFLGYPEFVRGYDFGSFTAAECDAAGRCPVLDRLFGSRMLVANLELRFPLLRPFGTDRRMYGPLPVEVALFGDAGVAWDQGTTPTWFGGERGSVQSAGVSFRINFLGFAIGQFSFVRPLARPGRGWYWQFSLTPGF